MKTVVLGFDGLDFRYLDRFESSLPNFRALRERGTETPLASTHPPWTGSAWPSLYTGTGPGHHGVYGFFTTDGYPDEARVVSRSDVRQPALWDYLSSEGGRSVVLNVPVTHPVDPIDGAVVPGYLAPEDEPGYPEGVRGELTESLGEPYRIYSRGETSDDLEEKFEGYLEVIDLRRRAAKTLLDERTWDLAFLQVQKTDAVFHHFDDDRRFEAIYKAADRFVGTVLEAVPEDVTVVVCSDHGIGPVTGYQIHVNEILREHGYLETVDDGGRSMPSIDKTSLEGDEGTNPAEPGGLERTFRAGRRVASRLGLEPADVYAAAKRVGLESTLTELTPQSLTAATGESVDWRRSRAYCPKGSQMGIRVNLAGREPDGVVSQSEYESVREELITLLSSLETPDGNAAFDFVCRRERLYDGPHLEDAPDVCFLPTGMNHTVSSGLYRRRFVPVEKHDHKRAGVFIGAGPGFADDADVNGLSIVDVAPTVLGTLGRPVPSRMTGSVPDGLLSRRPDRADYGEVSFGDRSSDVIEDEEVTERLEDLGYL